MRGFAATQPGLAGLAARELAHIGLEGVKPVPGGVEFEGGWSGVYRANLFSRVASRILVRVAGFPAVSFGELERKLKKVHWQEHLTSSSVEVSVTCRKSRLMHTAKIAAIAGAVIEERVASGAAADGSATAEAPAGVPLGVYLRIERDMVTVSLDTSGEHLHRRGYRTLAGPAPLRENVAAACLIHVGYSGAEPLLDPCCGSGTFPVEAAMIAASIAPGLNREFAFSRLAGYDEGLWAGVRREAEAMVRPRLQAPVFGSDVDPEAIKLTVASAKAAGVGEFVEVAVADMAELEPPAESGLLVANPPWGRRLKSGAGASAYTKLGRMLRGDFELWRWAVIITARSPRARQGHFALGGRDGTGDGTSAGDLKFNSGGVELALATGHAAGRECVK